MPAYSRKNAALTAPIVSKYLMAMAKAGSKTKYNYDRARVRNFQAYAGIKSDGIYGGRTRGALLYFAPNVAPPRPYFKPHETIQYIPREPALLPPPAPVPAPPPAPAPPPIVIPVPVPRSTRAPASAPALAPTYTPPSAPALASAQLPEPSESPVYVPEGGGFEVPRLRGGVETVAAYVPPPITFMEVDTSDWTAAERPAYETHALSIPPAVIYAPQKVYGVGKSWVWGLLGASAVFMLARGKKWL